MNAPVGREEHARALAPGRGCPSDTQTVEEVP